MDVARLFVPSLVYLAVILVAGLFGNTIVFYIYYRKFKPSAIRTFILAMSLCDFLTNVISLPMEVVFRVLSDQDLCPLCRIYSTVAGFLVIFSAFILVIVALNRYLKICRPTQRYPVLSNSRTALVVIAVMAGCVAVPHAVVSGTQTVNYTEFNVTGNACMLDDRFVDSVFLDVYNGIVNSVFAIGFVVIAVSYGLIGWRLWQHRKIKTVQLRAGDGPEIRICPPSANLSGMVDLISKTNPSCPKFPAETTSQPPTNADDRKIAILSRSPRILRNTNIFNNGEADGNERQASSLVEISVTEESQGKSQSHSESTPAARRACATRTGKVKRHKPIPRRTTLMMFVLTAVFVVNFLPYLISLAEYGGKENIGAGYWGLNLYHIAHRSYYISSAVNPVVFGFCSASFRWHCRQLFSCHLSN